LQFLGEPQPATVDIERVDDGRVAKEKVYNRDDDANLVYFSDQAKQANGLKMAQA
jgi:hypothetical protein